MSYPTLVCGLASLVTVPVAIFAELKLLVVLKARLPFEATNVEATLLVAAAIAGALIPFGVWRRRANAVEPRWSVATGLSALSAMGVVTAGLAFYVWLFGGPSAPAPYQ